MSKRRDKRIGSGSNWQFDDGTLTQRWQAVREELRERDAVDRPLPIDSIPQLEEISGEENEVLECFNSPPPDPAPSRLSVRVIHRSSAPIRRKSDRKAMQLCRQVRRAVEHALGSRPLIDQLPDCLVVAVLPAPHTAQLLIQVAAPSRVALDQAGEMLAILRAANGAIRSEVARSIHRRKTPSLLFQIVPWSSAEPKTS
ncbi:MAG: ribosome-binding factor A [Pirellulaceae bacterium]